MNARKLPLPAAFDWRETRCECDDGKTYATDHEGYFERRCEDCEGSGMIAASCADCDRGAPLNADGLCADCADEPLVEITPKYLGDGRWGIEA